MTWLAWAVLLYAVLSLGSMATMGIGAAFLGLALLFSPGGPARLGQDLALEVRRPASRAYLFCALALFVAILASLIDARLAPLSYGGLGPDVRFAHDLAKAWYLFWPIPLVVALRRLTEGDRARVVRAWLWAFGFLSMIGIQQHFTGWPRPQAIPGSEGRFHATLFLGHHLSVASVFIFPFFVALDLAARASRRSDRRDLVSGLSRGWLIAIAAVGLICLFDTYSRTLWVALPMGLVVWAAWTMPRKQGALAIGLAVAAALALSTYGPIAARLHNSMGIYEREDLWRANLLFLRERPFFGVGWHHNIELSGAYLMQKYPGQSVFSGHAHNNVLDVLAGLGAVGFVAWAAWVVFTLSLLMRETRSANPRFARGLFCAWLVFQLNGLTQVNFWEAKVLHQMMWVVAWSLLWASGRETAWLK